MSKGLIAGSCLCGGVGYHFEGDGVLVISHCHCSMCRKASGAAFASFVMVLITDFVWTRGEQLIHKYESSKGIFRCHCSCCGSPLPLQDPHLSLMAVPAGSLDSPSCNWPHVETFTDDALPFMRNKQGGGLDSLFDDAAFEEAVFKKNVREVLADELGDASIYGSERKAEGEEASHLTFLSFRQRESKAYWQHFLDKVNTRRAHLGLDVFPADFLEQITQRGDIG
ncbi:GFA family protein [Pseudomonadales bacterium]|nr:GFA family protein [Pseudomonadales bacterium]